jgi:hypothetical protein
VDVNSSANTLAYYDITIISALKGSIVQAPGANLVKILWSKVNHSSCKLYHFGATGKIVYSNETVQLTKTVVKFTTKCSALGA